MAFNLGNSLENAFKKKLSPGSVLPPPKIASGGPGNPGFISAPSRPTTASQDERKTKKLGIGNVQFGTNAQGGGTITPAAPGSSGKGIYGQFGGSGTTDYAAPTKDMGLSSFIKSQNKQGTGSYSAGGTSSGGAASMGSGTSVADIGTAPVPQVNQNTPAFYLNQLQELQKQYAPIIGSSAAMPGTSKGYGQDLANFNAAALQAKEAAPLAGLQATMPQAFPYSSNVINPVTGQSYGAGAAGEGGSFYGGQQVGNFGIGQQFAGMQAAAQAGEGIKSTIQQYLSANPQLNPTIFTDVNKALQFLNGKIGDPAYQTLGNYLNEYISTLAPILGVGGDTTNLKTQIAQSFVNAQASGQSISSVLDNIDQLARTKLNAIQGSATGGYGSGTGSGGGSIWDF